MSIAIVVIVVRIYLRPPFNRSSPNYVGCWLACPMPVCELLHTSGRAIFGRGLSVRVFEIASQRSARPGLGIEIASDPPSLGNYTTRKRRLSLDHSRALPQGDGGAGPAFAGGGGRERDRFGGSCWKCADRLAHRGSRGFRVL